MNRGWYTGVALAENPTTTVAILPVGTFSTSKYGKVALEEDRAQRICGNFNTNVLKTDVRFDIQHNMEEAAGWIVAGSAKLGEVPHPKTGEAMRVVLVDVEWTTVGARLLGEKQYRYVSAYIDDYKDEETGKVYHDVLKAVALCNDPVMKMLPAVELSEGATADETSLVFSEVLGDVVDELRRRQQEQKTNDTPPELRAASWSTWDAMCAMDTLVQDAMREGLTGEDLKARIEELCADMPDAIIEAIQAGVDRANEEGGTLPVIEAPSDVEQVDPTEGAASTSALLADDDTADMLAKFDTFMDSLADMVKGAKGVRMMRELAKATRSKLADILGQKGVTEKMTDENKEALELAEQARKDAEARATQAEQRLAERSKTDREAAVAAVVAKLTEKGVDEPSIAKARAILEAEDTSAIMLSEGGESSDLASAMLAFVDGLTLVPITSKTGGIEQPNPDDGKLELSDSRKEIRTQLGVDTHPVAPAAD